MDEPTITVTLQIPRSLVQQLIAQLWPPDPTLADDLKAISEKYLARMPEQQHARPAR
jgi:hypothetical protein